MTDKGNWVDEPVFEGVCPELKAYPELRVAAISTGWSLSDKKQLRREETWRYTTSIAL